MGTKRRKQAGLVAAALVLAVSLALLHIEGYGQVQDGADRGENRGNENGKYILSLYYDGADHKTNITAYSSVISNQSSANKKYNYMESHACSCTLASSNTSVATVESPRSTQTWSGSPYSSSNYWVLAPYTTLKIPRGYQTVSQGCVSKISSSEEWFMAVGFRAGVQGDYRLQIGGRTCNWNMSTDRVNGRHLYYKDLMLRIILEPVSCRISFDPAGGEFQGSEEPTTKEMVYNAETNATPGVPSYPGYTFKGWYTERTGGDKVFDEEGRWVSGEYWSEQGRWAGISDLTVYAQYDKIYDFSFDRTVSGIEFDRFAADDTGKAEYSFELADGQEVLFPGLDRGTEFQVREEGSSGFAPSYTFSEGDAAAAEPAGEAGEGEGLSTGRERLSDDMTADYTNRREMPEGSSLTLRKVLAGDRITEEDRDKSFEFICHLKGLDPRQTYALGTESELYIKPSEDGTAVQRIRIRGGESISIENLPDGTVYSIEETGREDFCTWYQVTDGEETTSSDYGFFRAAIGSTVSEDGGSTASAATREETLQKGAPVEYTFTNARYDHHDLTIRKLRTEDGREAKGDPEESFAITARLSGLEPNAEYASSQGTVRSEPDGTAEVSLQLRAGDEFSLQAVPGSASCTLTEEACPYIPSRRLESGGQVLAEDQGEYFRQFRTEVTGLSSDLTATIINEKPLTNELRITKEYDGLFDENTVQASFQVHLEGLSAGESYKAQKLNEEGEEIEISTISPNNDGVADQKFALKDLQSLLIWDLPAKASFWIEEEGTEGSAATYVVTSSDSPDLKSKSGSAEQGRPLRTETEKMTIDRSYSFYNAIASDPVKTVSDGDGLTKAGPGEEIERTENFVPKLTSGWVYHIHQDLPVPVAGFRCIDSLPAYVRTLVYDPSAGEEDAPLRVRWRNFDGSITAGGAVTDYDKDTGEYYVRDENGARLFSVTYDPYDSGPCAKLTVTAESEEMLRQAGSFDLFFKAYVDKTADREALTEAGAYDGDYYRFVNEAVTAAGAYVTETEPVTTLVPESRGLTVRKAVNAAEAMKEKGKAFGFQASFSGLEAEKTYFFRIPAEAEEIPFRADGEGRARVAFDLKDGQRAVFQDLPEDARYEIEEKPSAHYSASCQVIQGEQTVEEEVLSREGEPGEGLSTGVNRIAEGVDVTFQFTNTRDIPKVRILKADDRGRPVAQAAMAVFEGRHPAEIGEGVTQIEEYPGEDPVYRWLTDADGRHASDGEMDIEDGALPLQPGEYTLLETEVPDGSGLQIARPILFRVNEDGSHQIWDEAEGAYSQPKGQAIPVIMTDLPAGRTDLVLKKEVTGDLGDLTKEFEFTAEFTGLQAGKTYREKSDPQADLPVRAFTADENGQAEVRLRLKANEGVCFPALPCKSTYRITEAGSDHTASYRIEAEGPEAVIERLSDSNGHISWLSLATAQETVDPGEDLVRITYRNHRSLAPLTGIPSGCLVFWVCLLMMAAAVIVRYRFCRRKDLEL